jgi:transcriptional regulator with XRE-family HTH domain
MSQDRLAAAVGISRGHIARIELGWADPSLDLVARMADALGLEIELVTRAPVVLGPRNQRDAVHARCSGYADRRMRAAGWLTAREVEIVHARSHGWIDLLAFDPRTGTLIVIEIKTSIRDLGEVERQLGWYERSASAAAARLGWQPRRVVSWVLVLATEEADAFVRTNGDIVSRAFPRRAVEMAGLAAFGTWPEPGERGLALIDPRSRRRDWLIRCRTDGRRSAAPFIDHADAAKRLAA